MEESKHRKSRDKLSNNSYVDDGEQRYETDDENEPIYHPIVTEPQILPVNNLNVTLTESNAGDADIPNE